MAGRERGRGHRSQPHRRRGAAGASARSYRPMRTEATSSFSITSAVVRPWCANVRRWRGPTANRISYRASLHCSKAAISMHASVTVRLSANSPDVVRLPCPRCEKSCAPKTSGCAFPPPKRWVTSARIPSPSRPNCQKCSSQPERCSCDGGAVGMWMRRPRRSLRRLRRTGKDAPFGFPLFPLAARRRSTLRRGRRSHDPAAHLAATASFRLRPASLRPARHATALSHLAGLPPRSEDALHPLSEMIGQ